MTAPLASAAYKALDGETLECSTEAVSRWIEPRGRYISGFTKKWVTDTPNQASPYQQIARYDDVSKTVVALLKTLSDRLSAEQRSRLQRYAEARDNPFRPRTDAFHGPTERITAALRTGRDAFEAAAVQLRAQDETGTLDWVTRG